MLKLLTTLINTIFPPRKTEILLSGISTEKIDRLYVPSSFQNNVYLCHYQDEIVRAAILENKFHHNRPAAVILARFLGKWHKNQTVNTLYIPIPLGKKRQRDRGYNQVEEIIRATESKLDFESDLLKRNIDTPPQTTLNKGDREKNMRGVFVFIIENEIDFLKYQQVVIVDDVVTTGGTLNEARATLAPHLPPHITLRCLAIAH